MTDLNVKIHKLNTGCLQVTYQNPLTNKRKRHKCKSEKEAKAYRAELERQYLSKNYAHFSEMYVGNLIERHLNECPNSRFMERKNCFLAFCDEFSNTKLKHLNASAMRIWLDKLKNKQDYSEKTMNSIKSQLNFFFRFLEEQGLINESPLARIRFKRHVAPRRPRIVLSVDEVKEILENAKTFSEHVLYPYLACVVHTGARREEVVRLNRDDIDFSTELLHLKKTKNGRERFIRMSPKLMDTLKEHLKWHHHQPVFPTIDGKRINSHGELTRLMNKFKAFFPIDKHDWGPHALRHSYAYNFLKQGGDMYKLQAILGHRSIDVTVDLYGQLQAQDIECPSPYDF